MQTRPFQTQPERKLPLLFGAVVALMSACSQPPTSQRQEMAATDTTRSLEGKALEWTASFANATIDSLVNIRETRGIRFYSASEGGSILTVITTAVDGDGRHLGEREGAEGFLQFKEISRDVPVTKTLSERDARDLVHQSATSKRPAWSIDVDPTVLRELEGIDGAEGIGLKAIQLVNGHWTFVLGAVRFVNNTAESVGSQEDLRVDGLPCPAECSWDPAVYLQNR